jgi:galactose mutarotase-like enzyme
MIKLKNGEASYLINPFRGAASCSWKIANQDILYIEPKSYSGPQLKFKGGNPICFPVFSTLGLHGENTLHYGSRKLFLPQHGLARLSSRWRVNLDSSASAKLYLQHDEETLKAYPYPFELEISYCLYEDGLRLMQKVYNPGNTELPFVIAFHPYFKVSDPQNCEVSGYLPGTPCYAIPNAGTHDFQAHMPQNLPLGHEEINHHMVTGSRKITSKDRLSSRRISLHPSGEYPCLTLWSEPGQPFICMEPTSGRRGAFETRENLVRLAPGKSWEGQIEIRIESL